MLQIKHFNFGPFGTNTFVISDNEGHVLLIDPACSSQYEQQQLYAYISSLPGELTIMATHAHLDHLWGAHWACNQWHTSVIMPDEDIPLAQAMQQQYDLFGISSTPLPFPMTPLSATHLPFVHLSILPTPGHTPGSVCLYFPDDKVLFSGDTLFCMGYGRTDLPGGNTAQLIASLQRLFTLPSNTRVYPGHGDFTTIGSEKR